MKNHITKLLGFFVLCTALVVLDIVTKNIAVSTLSGGREIILVEGVLSFLYVENRGAAFGILYGQQWMFYIITVIVLGGLLYFVWKLPREKRFLPIYLVCILITAGAIGNFIDRISKQYVVDFIYFKLIDFPVFNVADIYVTVGCFLMVLLFLFVYKDEEFSFLSKKKERL